MVKPELPDSKRKIPEASLQLSLLEDMVQFIELYKNTVDYYSEAHPDPKITASNFLGLLGAGMLLISIKKAIEADK